MMLRLNVASRFPWVCSLWAGIVLLPSGGCSLIGVEPDEIDLAMGSDTEGVGETSAQGSAEGATEGDPDTGPDDTGDGDGDGDGDSSDAGGDGDGDPANETPCEDLGAVALGLGPNDVLIAPGQGVLMGSCGHPGPEGVYAYTTDAAVNLEFTLTADFDAAVYAAVGSICSPLVEAGCVNPPDVLMVSLGVGETIYVIVDSLTLDGGSGTLDVAVVP